MTKSLLSLFTSERVYSVGPENNSLSRTELSRLCSTISLTNKMQDLHFRSIKKFWHKDVPNITWAKYHIGHTHTKKLFIAYLKFQI